MPHGEIHPWADIKALYVTGRHTLREISELPEYKDVSYQLIRNRSAAYNWTKERLEYLDAEIKLAEAEKFKLAIKSKNEFDSMVFRATQVAVAHAANRLTQHNNSLNPESKNFNNPEMRLSDKQIRENMSIVKDAVDIQYRVWDVPAPIQRTKELGNTPPADEVKRELAGISEDLRYMELEIISTESSGGNGSGNGTDE